MTAAGKKPLKLPDRFRAWSRGRRLWTGMGG